MPLLGQGGHERDGTTPTPISEEKAKDLAQQYADKHLKGFAVDRVLPFTYIPPCGPWHRAG